MTVVLAIGALAVGTITSVVDAARAVAAPAPDDRGAAEVELLEPGSQPRRPLRISAPVGAVSTANMRQGFAVVQTVNGKKQQPNGVEVTAGLRMTVITVDAQGRRTIGLAYENASVPELNGVTGTYELSDRGFTSSGHFEYPPGTDPVLQQSLEQYGTQLDSLATPFPAEAVGEGARWKVTQHPALNGLRTTQEIVYTLTRRDGDRLTLHSKVRQTVPPQRISLPGMPANATARLVKSSGTGASDVTLDLAEVLPDDARGFLSVRQIIDIEQGGQSARVNQSVASNVTVTGS
jgi:hypothetical protein